MGLVGAPKAFPTPGRAPQHRHLILSGNRPPSIQPRPRPLPAHVQHGRVPPELHEVLTELALVFIQDVWVAEQGVSGTQRRGWTPAPPGPGPHQT